jgi:hypothetical protein
MQNWCLVNGMKLIIDNSTIISFTCELELTLIANYISLLPRPQCVKYIKILLEYKHHFHDYVDYIISQDLKMLYLIRYITPSFFFFPVSLSVWFYTAPFYGSNLRRDCYSLASTY